MSPEEQPDCVRRLRAMSSEEGDDDEYGPDEWVNTAREVIAAFEQLHAETASLRDQRDRLAQAALRAPNAADRACLHVLRVAQSSPYSLGYHLGPGTESFELLCAAVAERTGETVETVRARYGS